MINIQTAFVYLIIITAENADSVFHLKTVEVTSVDYTIHRRFLTGLLLVYTLLTYMVC